MTAAVGKGHKDVVPRPPANGQSTAVPERAQWSSCPHPAEMSKRAFTPAGARKCGGESWSDVGRKTTTTTPADLPPGGVSCRGVGMVASSQGEGCCVEFLTLDISVCLAGLAGVLGERGILGVSRGAPGLRYQCLCQACAGILGERGCGIGCSFFFRRRC